MPEGIPYMLTSIYHMPMSIYDMFVTGFITLLMNAILLYLTMKYVEKRAILIAAEIISVEKAGVKEDLQKYVNTEDFQKALYQIGGIFGAGATKGLGLRKGSGRMSMKGIITDLITGFVEKRMEKPPGIQNLKSQDSDTLKSA